MYIGAVVRRCVFYMDRLFNSRPKHFAGISGLGGGMRSTECRSSI